MGLPLLIGSAVLGVGHLVGKWASRTSPEEKAKHDAIVAAQDQRMADYQAEQEAAEDAAKPKPPTPPPSTAQSTAAAQQAGVASGIRQRKRAAAGGNPLFGRTAGAPAPAGSYQARTLIGS